jgi:hypothetical protein
MHNWRCSVVTLLFPSRKLVVETRSAVQLIHSSRNVLQLCASHLFLSTFASFFFLSFSIFIAIVHVHVNEYVHDKLPSE